MFETRVLRTRAEKRIIRNPELGEEYFYFDPEMLDHRSYVVVLEGEVVVGIMAFSETSIWAANALGVGFFETHSDHRQRGIAKLLVERFYQFAHEEKKSAVVNSGYAPDGLKWLRPLLHAAADRYPHIDFFEA